MKLRFAAVHKLRSMFASVKERSESYYIDRIDFPLFFSGKRFKISLTLTYQAPDFMVFQFSQYALVFQLNQSCEIQEATRVL